MMYFNYHPILGLLYSFDIIHGVELVLDAMCVYLGGKKLSPKDILDMYFQRGIMLQPSTVDVEITAEAELIHCNLFDCNDFAGVYQKLEI